MVSQSRRPLAERVEDIGACEWTDNWCQVVFIFIAPSCLVYSLAGYGILKIITYVAVVSNVIWIPWQAFVRSSLFVVSSAGIRHCIHFRLHPAHGLQICLLRHARLEGLHLSQPFNLQRKVADVDAALTSDFQFSACRLLITRKSGVRRTKTTRTLVNIVATGCHTTRPRRTISRPSTGMFSPPV